MENKINLLEQGLTQAFVCGTTASNLAYKPEFVSNDYTQGKKVISSMETELRQCDEFFISVAFITLGGITPLLEVLKELEEKKYSRKNFNDGLFDFQRSYSIRKISSAKKYRNKNV